MRGHAVAVLPGTGSPVAWLVACAVVGAGLRLLIRLAGGEEAFLAHGYAFNLTIAGNLLAGHGLCYAPGDSCALRLPVYPLLVAPFVWGGVVYPGVVMAQALVGGATAWLAGWLGREWFGSRVGLAAAAATALNPYAVVHDTALQDTALVNLLVLGAMALLVNAGRGKGVGTWLAAGTALAAAALTSGRVALFVPGALLWVLVFSGSSARARARHAVLVALPVALLVGAWMARNRVVVGAPVLTTEGGEALFLGNGPLTFTHFPRESIDLAYNEFERLPPDDYAALEALQGQDVARDNMMRAWAIEFIAAHPATVARGAVRKLWVAASAELSPAREPLVQWGYRLLFLPVHVLAVVGAWRARAHWRRHVLSGLLMLSFAVTTAVFWAHTSHQSQLHPLLFVYAAAAVFAVLAPRQPGSRA